MILYRKCPICGSERLKGFAIDTQRKGPHISRVECLNCKLVFANPMADSKELAEYYINYYDKDHYEAFDYKNLIKSHFQRISNLKEIEIKKEAKFLARLECGSKFLDIGCGLGLGLAYANQLNCELYATEFDTGALEFVKCHFPVETFQGDIWEAKYPDNHFDFIHISHVIEHVLDPKAYIAEMKRIVKPGGYIAIGTPNISSYLYRFHRWSKMLKMNVPDVIDGLEHTFIFPKKLLRSICEEKELKIEDHYTHNLGEKFSNLIHYKMPLKKKFNRLIQNAFQLNQWIVCKK
ncbi:methyltransferase domain-containing protein [uncultured Algoriphagus sp.]|uniref:class I SAM-dependent methyltransferase n=1 Tax=uncultured Algoriphagus sp. TaxID=417365 RepID=UPI0030ED2F59